MPFAGIDGADHQETWRVGQQAMSGTSAGKRARATARVWRALPVCKLLRAMVDTSFQQLRTCCLGPKCIHGGKDGRSRCFQLAGRYVVVQGAVPMLLQYALS